MATTLYTIGFAGRDAQAFFGALEEAGIDRLVDVRRWNTSQLAGYTKRRDLPFLLRRLCGAAYEHRPELAPAADLLSAWRDRELTAVEFRDGYLEGLDQADVAALAAELDGSRTVLLCSEADPTECHRRALGERLRHDVPDLDVVDL